MTESTTPRTDALLEKWKWRDDDSPELDEAYTTLRDMERELWDERAISGKRALALVEARDALSEGISAWIPVSERLPEPEVVKGETADFVPVLFFAGGAVCAGRYFPDFKARKRIFKWRSLQGLELKDADVSHWMPLPGAPK